MMCMGYLIKGLVNIHLKSILGIYVPMQLYRKLDKDVKELKNINNKAFIRKLDNFVVDLINARDKTDEFYRHYIYLIFFSINNCSTTLMAIVLATGTTTELPNCLYASVSAIPSNL